MDEEVEEVAMEEEVEEVNLVRTEEDAVQWLVEMTGCVVDSAAAALRSTKGSISDAVDILMAADTPDPGNNNISNDTSATEGEIRRLIARADNSTVSGREPGPIVIPDDDVMMMEDVQLTENKTINPADRIVELTGASHTRAAAALRITNGNLLDAIAIIKRQQNSQQYGQKRSRSGDVIIPSIPSTSSIPSIPSIATPKELSVLTWNIDGLCDRGRTERFSAVISQIKIAQPHVVMLQEVVDEHVIRIKSCLGKSYNIAFGDCSAPYFNVILIARTNCLNVIEKKVVKFSTSIMGRHYVKVSCELFGNAFSLYTSHLESLKDNSVERVKQLNQVFGTMLADEPTTSNCLFGGDLNIREAEVKRVSQTSQFHDVWETLGRDPSTRYTWDTAANTNNPVNFKCKIRFDRLYLTKSSPITPVSLNLVGKTMLQSCDMFPSDHWGLLATFKLPEN